MTGSFASCPDMVTPDKPATHARFISTPMEHLEIIPDESFEPLAGALQSQLPAVARSIRSAHLADLIDRACERFLERAAATSQVDELLLWGKASHGFSAGWSTRSPMREVVPNASADSHEGLIAEVHDSSKPKAESAEQLEARAWTNLESCRALDIQLMAAAPLRLYGITIAIISSVFYHPVTFEPHGAAVDVSEAASLLSRLIEHRLLHEMIGLSTH